ncbi:MAG: TetR family transcriptional regulator [Nitrospirae bacterium]|nr:TetR family transcriptional regulator [Nitrospirota bacterium]
MQVFWHKGYEATSMEDLLTAMNLNRGSLYNSADYKHQLFLIVIDRYCHGFVAEKFSLLDQPRPALPTLHRFIHGMIEGALADPQPRSWRRVCERFSKGNVRWQRKRCSAGSPTLLHGKMFAGIQESDLVVRVVPDASDEALKKPHTRPMDFTGHPIKGYIYAGSDGTKRAAQLRTWLTRGLEFVSDLPVAKRTVRRQRG